ncbi:MAG: thioredoxin family protein, partial [Flavobacterium sp.]
MSRCLLFFMLSYFFGLTAYAQPKEILFSELESAMAKAPRPVVVFLHTDWCSYCSLMERKTLKNDKVKDKLNSDFYYISFNAEHDEVIKYKGKN